MIQYLKKYLLCVLCVRDLLHANAYLGPLFPPTKGEIWPKPQIQKKSNQYLTLHESEFSMIVSNESCGILERAVERYFFTVKNISKLLAKNFKKRRGAISHSSEYQGYMRALVVELSSPCGDDYPYFDMDERYDLIISSKSKLTSASIWGVLRGLETWSQLFYISDDFSEVYINASHVTDFPRYSHRGLMLDTSRHFLSLDSILKTLDAMAYNKLNVFHWHIVDDQSFPYQSEVHPNLSKGAYHPSMVYTKSDINKVVLYARDRGIRVLPEFDVPGHSRSWGVAYPDILTECYVNNKVNGLGPMDPTKEETYRIVQDVIQEAQEWFPDKYMHVGGDEIEIKCWKSNPTLKKYMKEGNMTTSGLLGVFMKKVISLLSNKSTPIVWQESFDDGIELPSGTLVQVWKYHWVNEMISVLDANHKVIFSSSWYLDQLHKGGDWKDFFLADPRQMVIDKTRNTTLAENIVGGEACMWGEVVDDTNVISRTWPRASAVAERLWSPGLTTGTSRPNTAQTDMLKEAARRLEEHACRMRRRGVRAQPPNGPGFCIEVV